MIRILAHVLTVLPIVLAQDVFMPKLQKPVSAKAEDHDGWEGITIRLGGDNYGLCLDVTDGSTDNGTPIQAWECDGLSNQLWIWESGSVSIKLAEDQSKCIDAGVGWDGLFLWDCNDLDQQNWGYDADFGTIYLTNSADAGLCMDVLGGRLDWGAPVGTWDCNGCWNQQFSVTGPADSSVKLGSVVGDCPPYPSPSPPPASNVQDLCAYGDGGWPVFNSYEDLANDSAWSTYFQSVYGSIPSDGYPICVGGFWFLYESKLSAAGISGYDSVGKCSNNNFDHYKYQNDYQTDDASWIYHSSWQAVPGDTWVEVTHTSWIHDSPLSEVNGLWAMNAPGSGLWIYTGNTASWTDHVEGWLAMNCGPLPHPDWSFDGGIVFEDIAPCATNWGYDTIQFTQECCQWSVWDYPNVCEQDKTTSSAVNVEILIVQASGTSPCGGGSIFRAGWNAQLECDCNEDDHFGNCVNTQISPR